ncbi:MAG TPA: hypothetical protein DCO82_08045 [Alphaproteobacteria bacterium]|nr:hypothetical protein [Alphaproteobacteria bacterium]
MCRKARKLVGDGMAVKYGLLCSILCLPLIMYLVFLGIGRDFRYSDRQTEIKMLRKMIARQGNG